MSEWKLVESKDGDVHMLSPIAGGEFTLCGIAFDNTEDDELALSATSRKTPTCEYCRAVIWACRNKAGGR